MRTRNIRRVIGTSYRGPVLHAIQRTLVVEVTTARRGVVHARFRARLLATGSALYAGLVRARATDDYPYPGPFRWRALPRISRSLRRVGQEQGSVRNDNNTKAPF
ncbi:hypothetical protein MRX96_047999 [Rhipicephalus microplus]